MGQAFRRRLGLPGLCEVKKQRLGTTFRAAAKHKLYKGHSVGITESIEKDFEQVAKPAKRTHAGSNKPEGTRRSFSDVESVCPEKGQSAKEQLLPVKPTTHHVKNESTGAYLPPLPPASQATL